MLYPFLVSLALSCSVTQELGCFTDNNTARLLPHNANGYPWSGNGRLPYPKDVPTMTRELCAEYCCGAGWADPAGYPPPGSAVVGVEFGGQCWCGHSFDATQAKPSIECTMACPANKS